MESKFLEDFEKREETEQAEILRITEELDKEREMALHYEVPPEIKEEVKKYIEECKRVDLTYPEYKKLMGDFEARAKLDQNYRLAYLEGCNPKPNGEISSVIHSLRLDLSRASKNKK